MDGNLEMILSRPQETTVPTVATPENITKSINKYEKCRFNNKREAIEFVGERFIIPMRQPAMLFRMISFRLN